MTSMLNLTSQHTVNLSLCNMYTSLPPQLLQILLQVFGYGAETVWHSQHSCQDHVQLQTLIRSHCSSAAQLWSPIHHSGPRCTHTLPLSATLCISLHPVVTTLLCLPCCTVSSPCSIYIFYLVVFSPDLTYFCQT